VFRRNRAQQQEQSKEEPSSDSFYGLRSTFTFDSDVSGEPLFLEGAADNGVSARSHPLKLMLEEAKNYLKDSNVKKLLKQTNLEAIRRQSPEEILGGDSE